MSEIWQWSATEVAARVRSKQVSCAEVVDSNLARLDAVNPRINAVVEADHASARAAARAADEALRRDPGALGALHGVPVTIKINTDQRGSATSNGVTAFRDVIAHEDSPAVANWRRAGAIIIGRTNAPEFSLRWFTDNPLHGATINPWDKELTPGGSSGGAAAALAAGIGALAHGNDSAGSIRYPAFACAVAGVKPSFGRVPSYNPSGRGDRSLPQQIVSVQGLLARRVGDLRLGLEAMAEGDSRDPSWVPAPFQQPDLVPGAHIAVLSDTGRAADREIGLALDAAARALRDAGHTVETIAPPRFDEAAQLWLDIVLASNHYNLAPTVARHGSDKIKRAVQGMLNCTTLPDLPTFMASLARRDTILREWQAFLERYRAIVMPVSWKKPFRVDDDQRGDDAMREMMAAQMPMLAPSVLGLPSVAVPVPLAGGIRCGVQIVSARFHESACFTLAEAIEERLPVQTPIDPR